MSIETLCNLADFYGVTTDFLLGKTDTANASKEIGDACNFTGLPRCYVSVRTRR
jgi:hypothetical protein